MALGSAFPRGGTLGLSLFSLPDSICVVCFLSVTKTHLWAPCSSFCRKSECSSTSARLKVQTCARELSAGDPRRAVSKADSALQRRLSQCCKVSWVFVACLLSWKP